jgi:cellulose synthase/poly-beta-1,6-N-acetylglucosamine synthase-like glycosyltransferase
MLAAINVILIIIFTIICIYTIRHYVFYWNRLFGKQRRSFQDLAGAFQPSVSVIIPMHNEEKVASSILDCLVEADYPRHNSHYEVIVVDDSSTDRTGEIADSYADQYPFIKVIHRTKNGARGKSHALRVATNAASNEIILVFDADYLPSRNCIQRLVAPFCDPEIGVVMGRVVPINSPQSFLTRILDLERSGGYQVDQQARYNLGLITQYGGTVGGLRRSALNAVGGWDVLKLAEDTDVTYRMYLKGWRVGYVNIAECYEEGVPTWEERRKQLTRWAMGHNQCFYAHFVKTLKSPVLSFWQKIDGVLLLGVYIVPPLLLIGWSLGVVVYLFGSYWWWVFFMALFFTLSYNNVGNFAVFNEVGTSLLLDKRGRSVWLLPLNLFNFFANVWICSGALLKVSFASAMNGNDYRNHSTNGHRFVWDKTKRNGFAANGNGYRNGHRNGDNKNGPKNGSANGVYKFNGENEK